ncbi:hypothetical protein [Spirosoma oryzicola]|uniref:hypothetical protein n=1 Tax=Spirosoma oryzicola TaxID=2898794 RepID=UPI001E3A6A62|nr:hypothetical protein [Spirosoma oryzicola]UHG93269.1 hypothetical protein LQ777_10290 [Spirosoma oryzicola]
MKKVYTIVGAILLSLQTLSGFSQITTSVATNPDKPKTKLESFIAQDGIVLVTSFSTIGTVQGLYDSSVIIQSQEVANPTSGRKEHGITIEVKQSGRIEREHTSYVDYDEIESLLKGLDYIDKIDKSSVKLDDFQADYKTKGDLKFTTYTSKGGEIKLSITSGRIGSTNSYHNKSDIASVRNLLVTAKTKLDSIKQK